MKIQLFSHPSHTSSVHVTHDSTDVPLAQMYNISARMYRICPWLQKYLLFDTVLEWVSFLPESSPLISPYCVMPLKIKIRERVSLAEPKLRINQFTRVIQNTSVETDTTHNMEDVISPKGITVLISEEAGVESGWTKKYKRMLCIPVLVCSYIHCNFHVRMRTSCQIVSISQSPN